ncbi:hypothetical protein FB565_003200 [Actinoplanes lutulentus]|uniref:Uncharacterized protein n=1 Tax=Actinoplanes lutulentus TaxID=1287878 RepID=A0A327Z0H3_9ACTN|nr:hypothetical protein [Actinoplanes lutulentus]MBB2943487.1 hypothetical protein [Actinoplanes lutulentus]RAK25994.1 hypothetical protein B0I29_12930 [Actinoplanes lutulentus]
MTSPQNPATRQRSYLLVITLVVSALSLVVGLAGVGLAAFALSRSSQATDLAKQANERPIAAPAATEAAPAPETPAPTTAATPAEEPADGAVDPGTTETPSEVSPTAEYTIAYEGEHLRVRSGGCGAGDAMHIDLAEPRVLNTGYNPEFGVFGCAVPGQIDTSLAVAQVSGPAATPNDCQETIRTNPGRSPIVPTRGMTVCAITDYQRATASGRPQKLVFVTVDSMSTENENVVLNLTLKAWNIPQ